MSNNLAGPQKGRVALSRMLFMLLVLLQVAGRQVSGEAA